MYDFMANFFLKTCVFGENFEFQNGTLNGLKHKHGESV